MSVKPGTGFISHPEICQNVELNASYYREPDTIRHPVPPGNFKLTAKRRFTKRVSSRIVNSMPAWLKLHRGSSRNVRLPLDSVNAGIGRKPITATVSDKLAAVTCFLGETGCPVSRFSMIRHSHADTISAPP